MSVEYNRVLAEAALRRKQIILLRKRGKTLAEIAAQFGISRQRVHKIVSKNGQRIK